MNRYKLKTSLIVSIFTVCAIFSFNAQETIKTDKADSVFADYLLVNSLNHNKIIRLKDSGPYSLAYVEPVKDSFKLENIYLVTGNIRVLNASTLDFDIRNEAIEQNFKDGSIISTQNDYSSYYYSQNQTPRTIKLENIRYVDYASPARNIIHSIGISTMFASAATTLVLAPLFSTNFKNGNFNTNGYKSIAKIGLIGFATGIPIAMLTKIKRYNIADKQKQDKEFWYLERVENLIQE